MFEKLHVFKLLPKKYKLQLLFLQIFSLAAALFNVLGVGTILPFMSILNNPQIVFDYEISSLIFAEIGVSSPNSIVVTAGVVLFLIYATINILRTVLLLYTRRITADLQTFLSSSLFHHFLNKDITFYFENSSATLREYSWTHVTRLNSAILALLNMISSLFICLFIAIFLVVMDPVIALTMAAFISTTYFLQYFFIKKKLVHYGTGLNTYSKEFSKVINESFGGIKDIILKNSSSIASKNFYNNGFAFNRIGAHSQFFAESPKFVIETLLIGGLVGIVFTLLKSGHSSSEIAPILAVYAAAGYRLMPAVQMIYTSLTQYKTHILALDDIGGHLEKTLFDLKESEGQEEKKQETITFNNHIQLKSIHYSYPSKRKEPALKGVSCSIHKNKSIGFVGASGSGKSTTVEIILRLLTPSAGEIYVDDVAVKKEHNINWQKKIGYVPQTIFLCDATIAANIAFGEPPEALDLEKVKGAAKLAELDEFIDGLPQSYSTTVGERGVQLSGGQRQRIGIARALYNNPEILIFDEATSALDGITETAIIDSVNRFAHQKTIIMIAHRLSTVKNCDLIYFFEDGIITQTGTYNELIESVPEFKIMAEGRKLS